MNLLSHTQSPTDPTHCIHLDHCQHLSPGPPIQLELNRGVVRHPQLDSPNPIRRLLHLLNFYHPDMKVVLKLYDYAKRLEVVGEEHGILYRQIVMRVEARDK